MQKRVKGVGKLRRERLDGADAYIDGKAPRQVKQNCVAVQEKNQHKGWKNDNIRIQAQDSAKPGTQEGVGEQRCQAKRRSLGRRIFHSVVHWKIAGYGRRD